MWQWCAILVVLLLDRLQISEKVVGKGGFMSWFVLLTLLLARLKLCRILAVAVMTRGPALVSALLKLNSM